MNSKILAVLTSLALLSACNNKPEPILAGVTPVRIPNLPVELSTKAGRLPDITDSSMGGQVIAGIESDIAYNDVSLRYNKLIDLYICIQTSINDKKDPEKCLK